MKARDYPERARDAVKEMHRQVGDLVLDANGLAKVFDSPIIRIKDLELICEQEGNGPIDLRRQGQ